MNNAISIPIVLSVSEMAITLRSENSSVSKFVEKKHKKCLYIRKKLYLCTVKYRHFTVMSTASETYKRTHSVLKGTVLLFRKRPKQWLL